MLPHDSLEVLAVARGLPVPLDRSSSLDWSPVRASIRAHGMRNSNVLAIAPTATIANICDVSPSIEPTYKHLFVKTNLSGEFTFVNRYLVDELRVLRLWGPAVVDELKHHDGSVQGIEWIPSELKERYPTAFEIEPEWLIEAAARRQKWIDMGQSLNLYLNQPSGRRLNEMYMLAWEKGLKTTYYLRTLGATGVEKSTLDINRHGIQPRWMKSRSASADVRIGGAQAVGAVTNEPLSGVTALPVPDNGGPRPGAAYCHLDGDCESCQ